MKLTVLGKYGPYAAEGGATSSYLVEGKCGGKIVLDFGSGALSRLAKFADVSGISAVVISHMHYDHISDLFTLAYMLGMRGERMKLILPATDCPQREILASFGCFDFFDIGKSGNATVEVGEFTLAFTKMEHALESYSTRVSDGERTLFYSGDTTLCPQLSAAAKGSNLMLLDCGKKEGSIASHLSVREAADLAAGLSVPAIASHVNPTFDYTSPSPLVTIAEEGHAYEV